MPNEQSEKIKTALTQLPTQLLDQLKQESLNLNISPFEIGSKFEERYELGMVLGEGGAGRVIAAFDKNVRRRVAVKFIRSEKASEIGLRYF